MPYNEKLEQYSSTTEKRFLGFLIYVEDRPETACRMVEMHQEQIRVDMLENPKNFNEILCIGKANKKWYIL